MVFTGAVAAEEVSFAASVDDVLGNLMAHDALEGIQVGILHVSNVMWK